jgi:hypothetical protein
MYFLTWAKIAFGKQLAKGKRQFVFWHIDVGREVLN